MGRSEENARIKESEDMFASPDRREFVKLAVGSAFGASAFLSASSTASATIHKNEPGFKLTGQAPAKPTDDDLLFFNQIGVKYVSVASTPDLRTAVGFMQIKKRYADAGITAIIYLTTLIEKPTLEP
jgi:mannonate dehydratase